MKKYLDFSSVHCYYLLLGDDDDIKIESLPFNVIYRQSIKQIDIAFNTSEER